ncbi:MAG: hypothetical protein AAGG55_11270 [Pseudomonadota bacterium]
MMLLKQSLRPSWLLIAMGLIAMPTQAGLATVDKVSIKNGNTAEATYFYEQNWRVFREEALAKGYISGFRLLESADEQGQPTLLLITEYADEAQYEGREAGFAAVMPANGTPKLLNSLMPRDFRAVESLGTFVFD